MTAYDAARRGAALFDRSAKGKVEASGPDAPAFLTNLSTNDLRDLALGDGKPLYFLDHRAKVLFDAVAYHVIGHDGKHAIWLETAPGRGNLLLAHLDRYLISEAVELRDFSEKYAQFHLTGPSAAGLLGVPALAEYQHVVRSLGGVDASVRARNRFGPGFDVVVPAEHAAAVRDALVSAGATLGDAATYETMRLEAGWPAYGTDIDATRFVMELPRANDAVNYAKGCFIGQEPIIMSRDRAGHVNRAFLGMKVLDGTTLPAGAKVLREGQDVGVVTSCGTSPHGTIALGYLRRGHQDIGLALEADGHAVRVLGWPPVPAVV